VEAHRPKVEARLAAAKQIGAGIKSLPELTADRVTLPYGKIVLRPWHESAATDNAVLEEDATLPDLTTKGNFTLLHAGHLQACTRMMAGKYHEDLKKNAIDDMLGPSASSISGAAKTWAATVSARRTATSSRPRALPTTSRS
jgi:hypothetical protein